MPTHAEQRFVAYSPEQLFELVADVEKYPEFLPWCARSIVRSRTENELVADLTIGFGPFRESYTSRVVLEPPQRQDGQEKTGRIIVGYERGPFRHLDNVWIFTGTPGGCLVDFHVDFEFRSRLLRNAIGMMFNEGIKLMVKAFIARAGAIYGPAQAEIRG